MLVIEALSVGYAHRPVLHDVHLRVAPGEVVALLGPNGAGKTTLLRALSGVLPVRNGRVTWQGRDVLRLSPRARARLLAVVPQARQLPPTFTVQQAVLLGRTPYLDWLGHPGPSDHEAVRQALAQTALLPLAGRRLGHLSGGERQRVLLARALAQNTPILLLDEPTTHLDLRHQVQILALVRHLALERRLAVLMVLHDLNQAARYADRLVLLHHGRVLAQGAPDAVLTPERIEKVYGLRVRVLRLPDEEAPFVLPSP